MYEENKNENVENQEELNTENADVMENNGSENESHEESASQNKASNKSEKTFTQAQVNRMMAREKAQGRASVYNELGIKSGDKKMIQMFRSFMDSQKTDEEKDAEKEMDAQNKLNELTQRAVIAEAKAAAMMAGVKSQYVEDAVVLALAKIEGNEDGDVTTVLNEFKTKYPIWFGASEEESNAAKENKNKSVGQRGTGSSVKSISENSKKSNSSGLGARLAAQRKTQLNAGKKSFWN